MSAFERERLIIAVLISVLVHAGIFTAISLADFDTEAPEFSGPVYVDLPPVVDTRMPETEDTQEQEQEQVEEPPSVAATEERTEPPQPVEEDSPPVPEPPAPEQQPAPAPAPQPAPAPSREDSVAGDAPAERAPRPPANDPLAARRDAPVEVTEEELFGRRPATRRDREAPEDPEGFLPRETAEPERELPDWVSRTMQEADISTREMDSREATQLAEKIEADPELQQRLSSVIDAVERAREEERDSAARREPSADREGTTPSDEAAPGRTGTEPDGEASSRTRSSAGADLELLGPGSGSVRPARPFPTDFLSQEDFPGIVPAETSFVIVFDVSPSGIVVPGSVILQQKSAYTVVNEKIRREVLNWSFTPHGGEEAITAIFTPVVRREDVR